MFKLREGIESGAEGTPACISLPREAPETSCPIRVFPLAYEITAIDRISP